MRLGKAVGDAELTEMLQNWFERAIVALERKCILRNIVEEKSKKSFIFICKYIFDFDFGDDWLWLWGCQGSDNINLLAPWYRYIKYQGMAI